MSFGVRENLLSVQTKSFPESYSLGDGIDSFDNSLRWPFKVYSGAFGRTRVVLGLYFCAPGVVSIRAVKGRPPLGIM